MAKTNEKDDGLKINRISTGVKGLDKLVGGGYLRGHSVLVCGMPGTGKTIFGLQFLYKGIIDNNENGLYVTVEDQPEKLKIYSKQFGWDMEKLEKSGKISFLKIPIDQRGYPIIDYIYNQVRKYNVKRIVIDSLSALSINAKMFNLPLKDQPDPTGTISKKKILRVAGFAPFEDTSQFTYLFVDRIKDLLSTSLFLTDSQVGSEMLTKDGVSEYACDGVIQLQLHDTSQNVSRTLSVKKMRGASIIPGMNSLKFTKNGLEVGVFKAFY